jgi:hypothetical protein
MLFVVLYEPSFALEGVEVLDCPFVHFRGVLVFAGFEVYFRLDDVVERFRIAFGFRAGFLAV